MRVLLDECLPRRLALLLVGHDVVTVTQAGWSGVKNGTLLGLAQEGFDVFLTVDRNLGNQQNLSKFKIAIVVLESPSNELEHLTPLVPKLLELLSRPIAGLHRLAV